MQLLILQSIVKHVLLSLLKTKGEKHVKHYWVLFEKHVWQFTHAIQFPTFVKVYPGLQKLHFPVESHTKQRGSHLRVKSTWSNESIFDAVGMTHVPLLLTKPTEQDEFRLTHWLSPLFLKLVAHVLEQFPRPSSIKPEGQDCDFGIHSFWPLFLKFSAQLALGGTHLVPSYFELVPEHDSTHPPSALSYPVAHKSHERLFCPVIYPVPQFAVDAAQLEPLNFGNVDEQINFTQTPF